MDGEKELRERAGEKERLRKNGGAEKRRGCSCDYAGFERRIFLKILAVIIGTFLFILFLRVLTRGRLADWLVELLKRAFELDYQGALILYQRLVRNNIPFLMLAAALLGICLLLRIFVSNMTGYFDEISAGLDKLLEEPGGPITLSPEMGFLEARMNRCMDILEKRRQDARQEEQRKNDLVVYLAHDIRTPLTSVIGYLNLLNEAPDMPAAQRARYLGITLEKAGRLDELINEFFDITRFSLQKITLEKQPIDLYYMLVQMADEFYPLLEPADKRIVLHSVEDVTVYADPDKLARVFNNILKNAVAYSEEKSDIDVRIRQENDKVVITFTNFGKSIPKEKWESVFEKFFRMDEARMSDTGGVGLGLAIAKEIVLSHGGSIGVTSIGGVTVFTVILPSGGGEKQAVSRQ